MTRQMPFEPLPASVLLNEAASGEGDWELWFTGLIVLQFASNILPVHEKIQSFIHRQPPPSSGHGPALARPVAQFHTAANRSIPAAPIQTLTYHPHLHCLVPGVGLNARGKLVRVKDPEFLVYLPKLQCAFRQHFYRRLKEHDWQVDPAVWNKDWGVHIQAAGSGRSALKYLGTYVARTAINDARLVNVTDSAVTFRWKNRAQGNRRETATISGVEFVARYLRHVLPRGLRAIRYYGFCHPAAKAKRLRIQFHTGLAVEFGAVPPADQVQSKPPLCAGCGKPMHLVLRLIAAYKERGPPAADASTPLPRTTPSLAA